MVEMVVILLLVEFYWCLWLWLSIIGYGCIVVVVMVETALINTALFDCLFWSGIYVVGSGKGGIGNGGVGMVVLVMVSYWWSSDCDCGDDGCCNGFSFIKKI